MPTTLAARVLAGTTTARYVARDYTDTPLPKARERHLLNRFGAGYTPQGLTQLRRSGGWQKWFARQLNPGGVAENKTAAALPSWYPALAWDPATKWERSRSGVRGAWEHARDLGNLSTLRRVHSSRQVLEQMVDFWSNHLHVPAGEDKAWVVRKPYDDMLRRYALGSFEALLVNATLHPAMQLYLDNYRSVKGKPNENHGRELLELHTVGRDAGYTEAMVKDSAKILSGYTVDTGTWAGYYDSARHTTGPVTVLGFSHANGAADGRAVTLAYLRYLARHPRTARRIAHKLAVRFVSDTPSTALVNHLANVYLASGTEIKPVLRALVGSAEFWASAGRKVRTPVEDLIATTRVLRVTARKPTAKESFANSIAWTHGSTLVYQWPQPDGPPETGTAWSSATRLLTAFRMHWNFAGGWWPRQDVRYRPPTFWLPRKRIRLDLLVDHLSRTWLGRRSTARLLRAVCEAVDEPPGAVITRDHAVMSWKFPRLAAVLLDSPQHMTR